MKPSSPPKIDLSEALHGLENEIKVIMTDHTFRQQRMKKRIRKRKLFWRSSRPKRKLTIRKSGETRAEIVQALRLRRKNKINRNTS